ncbi:response regulator transcription factor [Sphingobacterium chuzhouense]|uniref:Response regulator transcription factor n=1 Tax=Sphingobacterium chuzhouense TaxID=1742264 RepID=A0ABR7XND2_9SPHI|nr:response regulator transcription factor [Sphingobacterium chuzhouense]MBD1420672.1 response regulator transcription factor [Sphingobacterium chuzhouense]
MKILTHAVVLDDHRLFADSFALLLQRFGAFDAVSSFSKVDEFIDFLRSFGNQKLYVFLDYYLPETNGLSILTDIKRLNNQAKIVFITSAIAPAVIRNILRYKPHGILSKSADIQDFIMCLEAIERGREYIDPQFEPFVMQRGERVVTFTPREIELLKYFSQGNSIAETAAKTFLSPHTIVAHRRKMMAKANCHTIAEMLTYAQKNHLI